MDLVGLPMIGDLPVMVAAAWSARAVLWAVDFGIVVLVVGIGLCIRRLLKGPHLADRALALDTIAVHLVGLVVLLTIRIDSLLLMDGALVLSLLGFSGTIAVALYILRPHMRRRTGSTRVSADPDD